MREIKFRAWLKAHSRMSYQVNLYAINRTGVIDRIQADVGNVMLVVGLHCEVMQFTGVKDKNGREIYEGDVVKIIRNVFYPDRPDDLDLVPEEFISVIQYRDHGFWVKDEGFGWEGEDLWNWEALEVIGSIHENPELLK